MLSPTFSYTRLCLILFILALPASKVLAQLEYYAIDTSFYSGAKLIDKGKRSNSYYCHVDKAGVIHRYGPEEVSEYGFMDGRVFLSVELAIDGETNRYFLERLLKGDKSLYYLDTRPYTGYVVEVENEFHLLPKTDTEGVSFKEQIKVYKSECFDTELVADILSYRKKPMYEYFWRLENCIDKAFPRVRYGFGGGYGFLNWEMNYGIVLNKLGNVPLQSGTPFFKAFCELPVFKEYISFHPEISYSYASFKYFTVLFDEGFYRDVHYSGKTSSLNVPLLLKASTGNHGFRAFINAGYIASFNFASQNFLAVVENNKGLIRLDYSSRDNFFPGLLHGFVAGFGVEKDLFNNTSLFLEMRYNSLFYSADWYKINNTSFSIQTGLIF